MYPYGSFSQNACMIKFTGGGPYDGREILHDHDDYAQISVGNGVESPCYNYRKAGTKHFRLASVNHKNVTINIWEPPERP